jgi:hypothetical protein
MRIILFVGLMAACGSKDVEITEEGDGGPGDGTVEDNSCTDDSECQGWEICEVPACVDGDRDNSFSEATNFSQSEEGVGGYINIPNDVDHWRYTATGGEFIRASIDPHEDRGEDLPEANLKLTVYTPSGSVLTSADDYPNGGSVFNYDSVIYAYLAYAGDYIFKVEDVNGTPWGGQDYNYTLRMNDWWQVTWGSDSSIDEPMLFGAEEDDGLTMTTNMWSAVGVLLEEEGDVDYIALNFADGNVEDADEDGVPYGWYGGEFTVDGLLDLSGSDATPLVTLHDPDDLAASSLEGVGPDGSLKYPALREGSWVLALSDANGGGGPNHWYAVLLNAEHRGNTLPWESESNDTVSAANAIELVEARNPNDKLFASGTIQGRVDAPGDVDHFSIMAPETIAGTTEDVTDSSQWVVLCMTSSNQGSAIAPSITVTDSEGNLFSDGEGETIETMEADPDGDPNFNIENIIITPGETLTIAVDPGPDTLAGPDEWYKLRAFIASFPVSTYDDGGYACP